MNVKMVEDDHGDYVRYDEAVALEHRVKELEAHLKGLPSQLMTYKADIKAATDAAVAQAVARCAAIARNIPCESADKERLKLSIAQAIEAEAR